MFDNNYTQMIKIISNKRCQSGCLKFSNWVMFLDQAWVGNKYM